MLTKRKGNGQTECYGCKQKGKFALNWDNFLYDYNNKPYCFECLMEELEQLHKENKQLKQKEQNLIDYLEDKIGEYENYFIKSIRLKNWNLAIILEQKKYIYQEILDKLRGNSNEFNN